MQKFLVASANYTKVVLGLGIVPFFVISVLPSSAFAQTAAVTVDTQRQFTLGDNEAMVSLANSFDGLPLTSNDVYAGAETTTVTAGGGGFLPGTFSSYCVDLTSHIVPTGNVTTVAPLNSSFGLGVAEQNPSVNTGGAIAWLYNNYASTVNPVTEGGAQQSAALQLSIWEVEYNWTGGTGAGNGVDTTLLTGNFEYLNNPLGATAAIRADANIMLTAWDGQTAVAQVIEGVPGTSQALVGPAAPAPTSVPEPAALALALGPVFGVMCPVVLRRRFRA